MLGSLGLHRLAIKIYERFSGIRVLRRWSVWGRPAHAGAPKSLSRLPSDGLRRERKGKPRRLARTINAAAAIALLPSIAGAPTLDGNPAPDTIFGTGNVDPGFAVTQAKVFEIGLRGRPGAISVPPEDAFDSNHDGSHAFHPGIAPTMRIPTTIQTLDWLIGGDWDRTTGYDLGDLGYGREPSWNHRIKKITYLNLDPAGFLFADYSSDADVFGNRSATTATRAATRAARYPRSLASGHAPKNFLPHGSFPSGPRAGFSPGNPGRQTFSLASLNGNGAALAEPTIGNEVGAVPLPASALLMLSAIGGLAVLGLTTRRAARTA